LEYVIGAGLGIGRTETSNGRQYRQTEAFRKTNIVMLTAAALIEGIDAALFVYQPLKQQSQRLHKLLAH
jgi:hypothetical protein